MVHTDYISLLMQMPGDPVIRIHENYGAIYSGFSDLFLSAFLVGVSSSERRIPFSLFWSWNLDFIKQVVCHESSSQSISPGQIIPNEDENMPGLNRQTLPRMLGLMLHGLCYPFLMCLIASLFSTIVLTAARSSAFSSSQEAIRSS